MSHIDRLQDTQMHSRNIDREERRENGGLSYEKWKIDKQVEREGESGNDSERDRKGDKVWKRKFSKLIIFKIRKAFKIYW